MGRVEAARSEKAYCHGYACADESGEDFAICLNGEAAFAGGFGVCVCGRVLEVV